MKMNAGKILILFYSVDCPHCQSMIPRLSDYLQSQKDKNIEVLAVSLDTDRNAWLNFIRNNKLTWINVNDPSGWGGATAADYYIYATPTMFLIDKDRKIISKPITIEELQKSF
jgi:peroxiredoxin